MKKFILAIATILTIGLLAGMALAVNGASTVTEQASSTANESLYPPANHSAIAGNVTEITISGTSTTQAWQGYYGNVSGSIELANAAGNVMYNWSSTNPNGEVYATRTSTIAWGSIGCFNWAADGVALETTFGISATDEDGINETFITTDHTNFVTGSVALSGCMTAKIFNEAGVGTFEEALLSDTTNEVYASLLLDDATGFDNAAHDFEMLVPEDGHGNTAITDYYFFVELA